MKTKENTSTTKNQEVTPATAKKAPKQPKAETIRLYKFLDKGSPSSAKGQVVTVLAALTAVKEGQLEDFVAKVLELNPGYKTKTPLLASVKFHLHQLARQGYVEEVDLAKAA